MDETRLCQTLQPILTSEVASGNSIMSMDTLAATACHQ
jgi:hypothetical protein